MKESLEENKKALGAAFGVVFGIILGYLFFNDLPDIYEVTGSLIISLSGLFIIYREYKVGVSQDSSVKDVINRGT